MDKKITGAVPIINLDGCLSLVTRAWSLYRVHFRTLIAFSLLFDIGILVSTGVSSFLNFVVRGESEFTRSFAELGGSCVQLLLGVYLSYVFAAFLTFVHSAARGSAMTIADACAQARKKYLSVFWVAILFSAILYASLPTGIFLVIFSIWFYFSLYIVALGKEHGFAALLMSRYLTHGIFWRVAGRYVFAVVLLITLYAATYTLLGVPLIGALLFALGFLAITLFAFPFFLVYEYYRYTDLEQLDRTVPFHLFRGERYTLVTWSILGFLFFSVIWTSTLLTDSFSDRIAARASTTIGRAIIPYLSEMQSNMDVVSEIINRFIYSAPEDTKRPLTTE